VPSLDKEILGKPSKLPVIIAPTGFNGLQHADGDICLARAAAAAGIPFTLSTASNCPVGRLTREVPGRNWFQLYPLKSNEVSLRLVERAAEAGVETLVITTDVPALGAREWDQRSYLAPGKLTFARKLDVLAPASWLWSVVLKNGGMPQFDNFSEFLPEGQRSALLGAKYLADQINPAFSWEDVALIRRHWKGSVVLKGILCLEDARRAVDAGVQGIVLTNHGGRQMDACISGVELLPAVRAELGGQLEIMVDGGFRRGQEILRALALGADSVMLGRATLYGLQSGGEAGVTHALNLLRAEMQRNLTLLGCASVKELGPHLLAS
jgi:(S)-mandelate dehydrogenase